MKPDFAREQIQKIMNEPKKFLFGIENAIEKLIVAMFTLIPYSNGYKKELGQAHVLLIDTPGVGKTDLVRSISQTIEAKWTLVQGHPLMMPGEILGDEIYNPKLGQFFLRKGKIFSNIFLFDEINRAHPKTQSVFLQVMEERIATLELTDMEEGKIKNAYYPLYPVEEKENLFFFWVLATANPIEQEGTFPLPEAQLDRFTFSFSVGYPTRDEEKKIRIGNAERKKEQIETISDLEGILNIAKFISENVHFSKNASEYMMRIIENTRPSMCDDSLREYINTYVQIGLSPRSNYHFEAASKAYAFIIGKRNYVTVDDIKNIAPDVMRHRIIMTYRAQGEKISQQDIVERILQNTEVA